MAFSGNNYFKGINQDSCSQTCLTGQFGEASTLLCQLCASACASCTSSATNCQSCQSVSGQAYFLENSTCTIACTLGTYGNLANLQCSGCAAECLSCFGPSNLECHNCSSSYFLHYGTNTCLGSCPAGQLENSTTNTCMLCSGECLTCSSTVSNCLTCGFSQLGVDLFFSSNKCLLNCPSGSWGNSSSHNCDSCTVGCLTCTTSGLTSCQSCGNDSSTQYYKHIGANTCANNCPDGQYIDAAYPNDCRPCASNCITCSGTADHCTNTNCSVNFFFLNNSCLAACPPDHYYQDSSSRQCLSCASGCLKCFGPLLTQCSECDLVGVDQYFMQIGLTECNTVCNPGEFPETANKSCVVCPSVCATCTSASVCQTCQSVNGIAYYLESTA